MDKNTQLYHLLKELGLHVSDRDDLGQIIGYSILNSLLSFKTTSGARTEIEFEEIKAIYAGLEHTISSCRTKNPYHVLCNLETKVRGKVEPLIAQEKPNETNASISPPVTKLLHDIISSLTEGQRHYRDHIKRFGLSLKQTVADKGEITGWKNVLIADYKTVRDIFVYK